MSGPPKSAPQTFTYNAASEPGGELSSLLAAFDAAKQVQDSAQLELDAATEHTNRIRDQIKAVVTRRFTRESAIVAREEAPGQFIPAGVPYERYELVHPNVARPFVLRWQVTHRWDTKRLAAEHPEMKGEYAPGVGGWVLERKRGTK